MSDKKGRGRPQKYPWQDWSNGEQHLAVQGEDFTCSLVSFRALVHRTANDRGAKAETSLDRRENKLLFRFLYPKS